MKPVVIAALSAAVGLAATGAALAQDAQPEQPYVTREQYDQLQRQLAHLQEQMDALLKARQAPRATPTTPPPVMQPAPPSEKTAEIEERLGEIEQRLDTVADATDILRIGTTDFLITGYASSTFTNTESGESSFEAQFNPIFLWRLSDNLSFAGELEFELGESENSVIGSSDDTEVNLEFLDISWTINDYLTLRAGKILTPLSTFKEQLHPQWINKLPDQPLFADGPDRLVPTSSLAFEARGSIPMGGTRLTYSAYVSNGPKLVTSGSKTGQLNFSNFSDINSGKAIGGRLGFFPIPELELAYAFNYADIGANDTPFEDTPALIQDVSLGYVVESSAIAGRLDVRGELAWSDVDNRDFGTGTFDNQRYGGYAQVAYRPTMGPEFLQKFEGVFRYDFLDNPSDATGSAKAFDEKRATFGLNYWINPSTVFKVAYRLDNVDDPQSSRTEDDALLVQLAIGF